MIFMDNPRAIRPVFTPLDAPPFYKKFMVEFNWFPGLSHSQTSRCINSLHAAADSLSLAPTLEVSTRSNDNLGRALSAFNLSLSMGGIEAPIECFFQGSKVFEHGGPYSDLYHATAHDAKTDPRIKQSGSITGFEMVGRRYPIYPRTSFYDHLYIRVLFENPNLLDAASKYASFTDIAFNPKKSLNCQAQSLAICVALANIGLIEQYAMDPDSWFLAQTNHDDTQQSLGI